MIPLVGIQPYKNFASVTYTSHMLSVSVLYFIMLIACCILWCWQYGVLVSENWHKRVPTPFTPDQERIRSSGRFSQASVTAGNFLHHCLDDRKGSQPANITWQLSPVALFQSRWS